MVKLSLAQCIKQQQQRHLPQRYFIQARLTDERKPSEVECTAFIKKKFWERLGEPLEFHVYVLVGEITIPIGLLKRPTPSASGC